MNFQETLKFLDQLNEAKMRLDLGPSQVYLQALNRPDQSYPIVLVGGTNGKGSTCEILTRVLVENGYRVGTYSSPHLRTVKERIRLNGEFLSEEDFSEMATEVAQELEKTNLKGLTYFEFLTMLAASSFRKLEVDWGIFEVGLGGRLDTTNALDRQILGLTRIGFDHESILGPGLPKIAAEKAALIRNDIPNFSVAQNPDVRKVLENVSSEKSATLFMEGDNYDVSGKVDSFSFQRGSTSLEDLSLGFRGRHQVHNAGLALAILDEISSKGFLIEEGKTRSALNSLNLPGRQESLKLRNGKELVLDVAHNIEAMEELVLTLKNEEKKYDVLFGVAKEKNWKDMLRELEPVAKSFTFVPIPSSRSWNPKEAMKISLQPETHLEENVGDAIRKRMDTAARFLCTGSCYLMDPALKAFEELELI